jgi:hypothetical protein
MDELDEFTGNSNANNSFRSELTTASSSLHVQSPQIYTTINTTMSVSEKKDFLTHDFLSNLLFEALDGFYFILNCNGTIETISDTASFYTKFTPVCFFFIFINYAKTCNCWYVTL